MGNNYGNKFKSTMYVTTYELAREAMADCDIAGALGVTAATFRIWWQKDPALKEALDKGRGNRGSMAGDEVTFQEYIYDHLSPNLRELWKEINACEELENGRERVNALLENQGKRARQHLFLYALTQSLFNVSKSLRKLSISRKTYETWRKNDPDFLDLMDEIHWHKKNFFEQAFMYQVATGNPNAIIHAVKTQCKDRGYNDKLELEVSGTVTHNHLLSVSDLNLDISVKKSILEAIRERRKTIDVDAEEGVVND